MSLWIDHKDLLFADFIIYLVPHLPLKLIKTLVDQVVRFLFPFVIVSAFCDLHLEKLQQTQALISTGPMVQMLSICLIGSVGVETIYNLAWSELACIQPGTVSLSDVTQPGVQLQRILVFYSVLLVILFLLLFLVFSVFLLKS